MAGPAVDVVGLKEFRRDLRAAGAEWPRALRKANKEIAQEVADVASVRASGMGGVQAKAAGMIRGYATQVDAAVGFPSGTIAGAAFWGTLRHTGWYAAARFADDPPQHPPWVGASWEPGVAGQGPYVINDAIAAMSEQILSAFGDSIDDITHLAFPD